MSVKQATLTVGQTWYPKKATVKPRKIEWIGIDDCHGEAVKWRHPFPWGGDDISIMQEKAFRWWIRKHEAILP